MKSMLLMMMIICCLINDKISFATCEILMPKVRKMTILDDLTFNTDYRLDCPVGQAI